jgi:ketosteroid isomerase-like protein
MPDDQAVMRRFVEAFAAADVDAMRSLLAADVTAYITNAEGGVDRVDGREGYISRVPDAGSAQLSIDVTQAVTVAPGQVLTMVEIRAVRGGKTLHNFAAFLTRVRDERITEIWMVEALPAYSDEFWS